MAIDKGIIKSHYEPRLDKYKENHQILNWENREAQLKRFRVFIENVDVKNRSLLDVGCGLGDLYSYIKNRGINVEYTGIDILEKMITGARAKNPGGEFFVHDLFSETPDSGNSGGKGFDIVFSSGLFNLKTGKDRDFLVHAVSVFYRKAKQRVVFNLLDTASENKEDIYCYYSPEEIEKTAGKIFAGVKIIKGYLPNDFTVICDIAR